MQNLEEEYRKAFRLNGKRYRRVKEMDKPYVGVSLVIDHDQKLLKKLSLDGHYICLMRLLLDDDWRESNSHCKKVVGFVNFTIDPGDEKEGFPILDLKKNLGAWLPLDLSSTDEYYFDVNTKKFFTCNKEVALINIADELFEQHVKPTKIFAGMYLRSKLRAHSLINGTTLRFAQLIAFVYFLIYGEKVGYDFFSEYSLKHFNSKEEIKLKASKTISIFGYAAAIQLIFVFCLFHLLAYFIVTFFEIDLNPIIKNIFKNNFITLIYSIAMLYLLEEVLHPFFRKGLLLLLSKTRKMNEIVSSINIQI